MRGFDAEQWKAACYDIVVEGNRYKFEQNADLSDFLLSSHHRILVEASPFDNIWGIGLAADAPQIEDPTTWQGQYLLGFALMDVRSHLMEQMEGT